MNPILFFTILIVLSTVFIFLTWYFSHKAKAKERLMIIEKGIDVEKLLRKEKPSHLVLTIGIIIIGLGVAFGLQALLLRLDVTDEPPYLFVLFVCGGVSLLIIHFVTKRGR